MKDDEELRFTVDALVFRECTDPMVLIKYVLQNVLDRLGYDTYVSECAVAHGYEIRVRKRPEMRTSYATVDTGTFESYPGKAKFTPEKFKFDAPDVPYSMPLTPPTLDKKTLDTLLRSALSPAAFSADSVYSVLKEYLSDGDTLPEHSKTAVTQEDKEKCVMPIYEDYEIVLEDD